MMNKYEKTKKKRWQNTNRATTYRYLYQKNTRHATNRRRMACVVINKSSRHYQTYKLLSEYGVLNIHVTGNTLLPFLGIIKEGPPSRQISLSEAYKIWQALDAVFCYCETACNTKSCICYSASK